MQKISTDFINYGTYKSPDADILKGELEKNGIPVKILYPGTNIGRDASGDAYYTAFELLIRICDFQKAEEVKNSLNITPIEVGEPMPLPKVFKWTKNNIGRFFLIGMVIFLLALITLSAFSSDLESVINPNNLYAFLIIRYLLLVLLLGIYLFL